MHGLNGHPINTFKHENGTVWIENLLPTESKFEKVRIMTFGYDARTFDISKPVSDLRFSQIADQLINEIARVRDGKGKVCIIEIP